MDPRLAPRVDASDVVQETLARVPGQLPKYLRDRPGPFYLWLRQQALRRLVDLSRRHISAQRRSVEREAPWTFSLSEASALELADQLLASGTSPSARMQKRELQSQVRAALVRLPPADREVLVLRYVEQLKTSEIAVLLEITERGVRKRHLRALERLGKLLGDAIVEGEEQ
jgi:RNA polymerase sigma-70 factor (ECF subfamily)